MFDQTLAQFSVFMFQGYLAALVILVAAVGTVTFASLSAFNAHYASMVGLALTYAIVASIGFHQNILSQLSDKLTVKKELVLQFFFSCQTVRPNNLIRGYISDV